MIKIIDTKTNKIISVYNQPYWEHLNNHSIKDFKNRCLLQTYFMEKHILLPRMDLVKKVQKRISYKSNTLDNLKIIIDNTISLL